MRRKYYVQYCPFFGAEILWSMPLSEKCWLSLQSQMKLRTYVNNLVFLHSMFHSIDNELMPLQSIGNLDCKKMLLCFLQCVLLMWIGHVVDWKDLDSG